MSASTQPDPATSFEPYRRSLLGLAYRMLGSMAEAEDVVQDAYLRWHGTDRATVEQPRAFLGRTVTRLCLDELKSARMQREEYIGPWLPEPLLDEAALAPDQASEFADDLSMALLLTLERLSPLERAAFLMHDVFDLDYPEVARTLRRSEEACRQLASRARSQVRRERPRYQPSAEERQRLTLAFAGAIGCGDIEALTRLLAEDAVFYSDGGGKVAAARKPILGALRIARFLTGLVRKPLIAQRQLGGTGPLGLKLAPVNGMPGMVLGMGGRIVQTYALEIREGRIAAVYVTRNPEKLAHLQP
ncbi:RNA polymerase sigma-70 factor [Solimonas sp. K1W22B-7]|uniref:sigma-70 family RNA polymerase sigma factor n=1 Tax=Solimonas sp. K1W22B-7 TaxID=2303331 RepID=UPI000E33610A|nr:sigma-70 family RNA polymerase sigma factor [Solimonas sp. K1W22B-7]AXQ28597.1 RNA polymerase sigma-70 factor [Solimonas sp. K1W22B-7]